MHQNSQLELSSIDVNTENQLKIPIITLYDSKSENSNTQFFQFNDLESKASSRKSNGTHQTSFDFSESSFQNEALKAQDLIRQQSILSRKVTKKQLTLIDSCFSHQFIKHIQDQLIKFHQYPDTLNFYHFLKNILKPNTSIFTIQQCKISQQNSPTLTIKQVMQGLVCEKTHWFFIFTHNLIMSSLGFFILLIIFWINAEVITPIKIISNKLNIDNDLINKKIKKQLIIRKNIIQIVHIFIENHTPQINENQVLLLLILNFLDTIKKFTQISSQITTSIQINLAKKIKILRSMELNQKNFSKNSNQSNFQKKLQKFQQNHSFISSPQFTYHLINTHILESFSGCSLEKFYRFDSHHQSRKQYQTRKDLFCLWILQNIMKEGQYKSTNILHNSSMYIIQIMGMLKKMKNQNNIEGISYLIPIVANLRSLLPKVWKHVIRRRPEVETKFNQYTELLLQNRYKSQHFGQSGIIWGQTIYIMTQKALKYFKNKKEVQIDQHKKYYNQFISHLLFYRRKAEQIILKPKFQLILDNEDATGLKISIIEKYLIKKNSKTFIMQSWNNLTRKAQKINQNINQSVLTDIFDYCFIGSTQKYNKVDI